jgi:hypothetical protein
MVPLPPITPPSKFTLDIFSVVGFFGGDEVVEATTISTSTTEEDGGMV